MRAGLSQTEKWLKDGRRAVADVRLESSPLLKPPSLVFVLVAKSHVYLCVVCSLFPLLDR